MSFADPVPASGPFGGQLQTTRRELMRKALVVAASAGALVVADQLISEKPAAAAPAYGEQDGWRWCRECQGLFYGLNGTNGVCTAVSDGHNGSGSSNYWLYYHFDAGTQPIQNGWRWCNKCQGLFFGSNGTNGVCPAGGGHDRTGSFEYGVWYDQSDGQGNWRWCSRCQGLFFADNPVNWCPAIGHHDGRGSWNYFMYSK